MSPLTLTRRLVAIGRVHSSQKHVDSTKTDLVRTVMRGIKRKYGTGQDSGKWLLLPNKTYCPCCRITTLTTITCHLTANRRFMSIHQPGYAALVMSCLGKDGNLVTFVLGEVRETHVGQL